NSERNPISVFAATFDIVGRIIVVGGLPQTAVEQLRQMIETDRRAPQRREVKGPHSQVLLRARWIRRSVGHRPAPTQLAGPDLASGTAVSGKNRIRKTSKNFKRRRSKFFKGSAPSRAR